MRGDRGDFTSITVVRGAVKLCSVPIINDRHHEAAACAANIHLHNVFKPPPCTWHLAPRARLLLKNVPTATHHTKIYASWRSIWVRSLVENCSFHPNPTLG